MIPEAYRRPGFPAVLLLVILGLLALWIPKVLTPPMLVAATDASVIAPSRLTTSASPIPVVAASLWLDRQLANNPASLSGVMHAHSVLAHLLAATVLLFLLVRLGLGRSAAVAGVVIFVVHPSALEVVSLVGFRTTVLATLFALLALAAVARAVHSKNRLHALPAVGFAVMAAAASPSVGLLLPALAYLVGARAGGRGVVPAVGLAMPVFGVLCLYTSLPFFDRSIELAQLTVPVLALAVPVLPASLGAPPLGGPLGAGVGVLVLAVLVGLALMLRRRQPSLSMALGLLAVGAVPAIWSTPLAASPAGYLVLVGVAATVAALRLPRRLRTALAALAVLALVVVDWRRGPIYRDAEAVFTAAAEVPLARALLGEHLAGSMDGARQARAIEALREALPQLPVSPRRFRLEQVYVEALASQGLRGEAADAAVVHCRTAEELGAVPARLTAYLLAADCFSVAGQSARVDGFIEQARALQPDHPVVLAVLGERQFAALVEASGKLDTGTWIAAGDQRLAPIEALADQALAGAPGNYRALLLKGRIHEARGEVLDALPRYEQAVAAAPHRAEPRLLLTRLYLANDMVEAAETCVRDALREGVDEPRIHFYLVTILTTKGQVEDALQYLEVYAKNHHESRQARVMLASLLSAKALRLQDQAKPARLAAMAQRIERLNPGDPKGFLVRAVVMMRQKPPKFEHYVQAIVLIENARLAMPGDADVVKRLALAHRDLGWKLMISDQQPLAMDHFRQFLDLAPKAVEREPVERAYLNRCRKLQDEGLEDLQNGLPRSAEKNLRRLTELLPENSEVHFHFGLARLDQDEFGDAVVAFEKAIAIARSDKSDASAYLLPLLETMQRMGRVAEARRRGQAILKNPGQCAAEVLQKIRQRVLR